MSADGPIHVDPDQAAALRYSGRLADFRTLRDAVLAWNRLPESLNAATSIVGGAFLER
jgi:hypothetical protein